MNPDFIAPCPCGSGRNLGQCCGPCLAGTAPAPTAAALMRSRYTAFVLRDAGYLAASWHPATRPAALDLAGDDTEWTGLDILGTRAGQEGDDEGEVEFKARFRQGGRAGLLHEISRFRQSEGRWLYLDGKILGQGKDAAAPGRNAPCPCGSGKKYKRCCG